MPRGFRPAWTPLTITLMVLGFIIFWPLGLAMLAYILWGDRLDHYVAEAKVRHHLSKAKNFAMNSAGSGNVAFDDYRTRELNRLEEERRQLDTMRDDFDKFIHELRYAKDKEEFDRFMANRGRPDTNTPTQRDENGMNPTPFSA